MLVYQRVILGSCDILWPDEPAVLVRGSCDNFVQVLGSNAKKNTWPIQSGIPAWKNDKISLFDHLLSTLILIDTRWSRLILENIGQHGDVRHQNSQQLSSSLLDVPWCCGAWGPIASGSVESRPVALETRCSNPEGLQLIAGGSEPMTGYIMVYPMCSTGL